MTKKVIKYYLFLSLLNISHLWANPKKTTAYWGFFAHERINKLSIYTLPPEMGIFYKKHSNYLTKHATDPDKRRYLIKQEAPRHFIDLEAYGDSIDYIPLLWKDAVAKYSEDSLYKYGIVLWHIPLLKFALTKAFQEKDTDKILKISSEIGHYIADANVPLHTTWNYNGQMTNQHGIHAFWESRLPELFSNEYNFWVGKANYINKPSWRVLQNIKEAHACLDSVLNFEKKLSQEITINKKYTIEQRNKQNVKTYSKHFSKAYHQKLQGQVERQMRKSIQMIGDFWYTAWVDAGQPSLDNLPKVSENQEPDFLPIAEEGTE